MGYLKSVVNGYILGLAKTNSSGGIADEEYSQLSEIFRNKPEAPDGYFYRLKSDDLTWELCECTASEEAETMTETEEKAMAYDILMGVIS